jgi:plasmid stability protein
MAILHVRDFPVDLHQRLKERAADHRRSLSAEVVKLLEWAVTEVDRAEAIEAVLAAIANRRSFAPADIGAPDSTSLIREDRDR